MPDDRHEDDRTQSYSPIPKGTAISRYRIVQVIGVGGMGEVYLAEDTELDRKVALKFLPSHLCRNEDCRKRFKREAQAAAKLDHPNIVPVYEVSEHQGRPYFAMAHVEGQSLRETCEGLQEAHEAGVVHRDIKPSNIILDSKGRARLLDFGLAMIASEDKLTKTGSTLGTVGYMSPEQVVGEKVDHRSDLFSVGVILYEMLTDRRPFEGDNDAAILRAITDSTPEPVARFKSGVTPELQQVIDKALTKDASLRYQHADGMLADLKRLKLETAPIKKSKIGLLMAAAVIVVVAAIVLIITKPWITQPVAEKPQEIMLAVLPFENLGAPEDEYFADGITDEIMSRLAKISALGVISRTSAVQYKGTDKSLPQIAEELSVDYILEGAIRWDKGGDTDRVRITPQLIRVSDNTHLWTDRYNAVLEDIFAVQSNIAERVAEELHITLLDSEREDLNEQPARNIDAYDFYLRGRRFFSNHTPKDYFNAEEMFQKAIELEPDFVSAHAWLSSTHTQIYSWYLDRTDERLAAAKESVERALEIAPDHAEARGALAWYHYAVLHDNDRALEEFTALRERYPSDAVINYCIAQIERRQGKWEDAVADFRRAVRLSPRVATFYNGYGVTMHYLRRYAEAESLYSSAIELKPDFRMPHTSKVVLCLHRNGDIEAAREILQEALQKMDRWPYLSRVEAEVEMGAGNYDRALTLLEDYGNSSNPNAYDSAHCYEMKGSVCRYSNKTKLMESYYDSSRIILERLVSAEPDDPWNHMELGLTYAGLGREQEALREGQLAVKLLPVSEDAIDGTLLERNLAEIYCMIGKYDQAIEKLDYLLSIPSKVSVPYLRIWPEYAPLRELPQFQALLEKYEKEHGT